MYCLWRIKQYRNLSSTSHNTTATIHGLPIASSSTSTGTACEGATISLTGSASGGSGGGYTYSWTGPNSYSSSAQSPTVSSSATTAELGSYGLVVTDGNSRSSATSSTSITVKSKSNGKCWKWIISEVPGCNISCYGGSVGGGNRRNGVEEQGLGQMIQM